MFKKENVLQCSRHCPATDVREIDSETRYVLKLAQFLVHCCVKNCCRVLTLLYSILVQPIRERHCFYKLQMRSVMGDIFDQGLGNTVQSEICKQIVLKNRGEYTFMCDQFVYFKRRLFKQHIYIQFLVPISD